MKVGSIPRRVCRTVLAILLVIGGAGALVQFLRAGQRPNAWSAQWIRFPAKGFALPPRPAGQQDRTNPTPNSFVLELLEDERHAWGRPTAHVRLHCHPDEWREVSLFVDGELVGRYPAAPVIEIRFPGSLTSQQRCSVQVGPPGEESTVEFFHRGPFHVDLRRIGRRVRRWFR